jgi:peptidoglycan hydrolase-like protein with peptidoglycan-binding domain
MKKFILGGALCTLAVLGGSQAAFAETVTTTATTTPVVTTTSVKPSQAGMLEQIQQLMKLIAELKAKLMDAQGQIQVLAKDLGLGSKGNDVLEAQKLLASDPTTFKAKPTGFFGPLTQEAIKKFQTDYNLPVTGVLDQATRDVMKQIRSEQKDGKIPFGLIKSKEMHDKIKAHMEEKRKNCETTTNATSTANCMKEHGDKKGSDGEKGKGEGDRHMASSSREFSGEITTHATSTEEHHGTSTKDHVEKPHATSTKERTKGTASSTVAVEATKAMADAQTAITKLTADIAAMTGSSTDKQVKEAKKRLDRAKAKLGEAQKKFDNKNYRAAIEKARQALKAAQMPAKKMEETKKK